MKKLFNIFILLGLFFGFFGVSNAVELMFTTNNPITEQSVNVRMTPWYGGRPNYTKYYRYIFNSSFLGGNYYLPSYSIITGSLLKQYLNDSSLGIPYGNINYLFGTHCWSSWCPDDLPVFGYSREDGDNKQPRLFLGTNDDFGFGSIITYPAGQSMTPSYWYNTAGEGHNLFFRYWADEEFWDSTGRFYFEQPYDRYMKLYLEQRYEYGMMRIEQYSEGFDDIERFYAPGGLSSYGALFLGHGLGFSMVGGAVDFSGKTYVDWEHTLFRSIGVKKNFIPGGGGVYIPEFKEYNGILIIAPNLQKENYGTTEKRTLVLSKDSSHFNRLVYNLFDCAESDFDTLKSQCNIVDMGVVRNTNGVEFFEIYNNSPNFPVEVFRFRDWTPAGSPGNFSSNNGEGAGVHLLFKGAVGSQSPYLSVDLNGSTLTFTKIAVLGSSTFDVYPYINTYDMKLVSSSSSSFDIYLEYNAGNLDNPLNFISPTYSGGQYIPGNNVIWTGGQWTIVDSGYNIDGGSAFVPTTGQGFYAFTCPYDTSGYPGLNLGDLPVVRTLFPTLNFDIIKPITCIYAGFRDGQLQQADRLSGYTNSNMFGSGKLFEKSGSGIYEGNGNTSSNKDLVFRVLNLVIMGFAIFVFYKLIK